MPVDPGKQSSHIVAAAMCGIPPLFCGYSSECFAAWASRFQANLVCIRPQWLDIVGGIVLWQV